MPKDRAIKPNQNSETTMERRSLNTSINFNPPRNHQVITVVIRNNI